MELHVGQPAVSKQLSVLEEYLGVELFRRERRGINLTLLGDELAQRIAPAFDLIADATAHIMERGDDRHIRVQTYTTFAAKWLIPRLEDFHNRYPDLSVLITNSVRDVQFDQGPVHFSIQLGRGVWDGADVDFLFEDVFEPVCSPGFLRQHAPERRYPQALLRTRLLVSHYRRKDWSVWAKATRYEDEIARTPQMSFSSSVLAWQAALDGLGVAVGQTTLLMDDLAQGKLQAPFNLPVRSGMSYYLLRPKMPRENRKLILFRDWILEQCSKVPQML